jgi:hypothetical protein
MMGATGLDRIYGNEAVLSRLEHLGRNPRTLPNLTASGFPLQQLDDARNWYSDTASTPVEHYASQNMTRGFFEDESLLNLFCRYFECEDWKLESSPWFFSGLEYDRLFSALIEPIEFETLRLTQGIGVERWGSFFLKLPFELGMEKARIALWGDICHQEHYFRLSKDYLHLRAGAMFGYLQRTLDLSRFSPAHFNYQWEGVFRERLRIALRAFENTLEEALRIWLEVNREWKGGGRWISRARSQGTRQLIEAFTVFGLSPDTATLRKLRSAFRHLSKQAHPDQGGTPAAFRKLTHCKDVMEAWLTQRASGEDSTGP